MAKKRIKIGQYKTAFKGAIFKIRQAKIILPSGKIKISEQAVRLPTVTILAIDDKGRLLLTREYRLKHGKYLWRLPAGKMDKEKSPLKAAQRELQEETNFKAKTLKLFHITNSTESMSWKRYAYIATNLTFEPLKCDEDEDIKVIPTPIAKAFKMVIDGKIQRENMAYLIMKLYYSKKQHKL